MSYKTIVVHLDDGPRCAARVALAAGLAARYGSRLVGIAATGVPDVIVAMNSAVPGRDRMRRARPPPTCARTREAAARAFEQQCRRAGVASFAAEVVVDEAVDAVVRRGRCSDLIVVGQTDVAAPIEGIAVDFPQQVLLHAGPPVLVVPYAGDLRLARRARAGRLEEHARGGARAARRAAAPARRAARLARRGRPRSQPRPRPTIRSRLRAGLARLARRSPSTPTARSSSPTSATSCCRAPATSAPTSSSAAATATRACANGCSAA